MDVAQPLKQTDVERPWKNLGVEFGTDPVVKAMLNASIDIELGDGNLTFSVRPLARKLVPLSRGT